VNKPDKCFCGKGHYKYGSALYAYYSCGHAYEKPLNKEDKGNFLTTQFNPYEKSNA
jgi:hypothetical protein